MTDPPPNPGSDAALAAGCRCAVIDNNHGKFPAWPPDGWWINDACPLHSTHSRHEGDVLGRLDAD